MTAVHEVFWADLQKEFLLHVSLDCKTCNRRRSGCSIYSILGVPVGGVEQTGGAKMRESRFFVITFAIFTTSVLWGVFKQLHVCDSLLWE